METCLLPFHNPYSRLAICENCVEYSQVAEKALELKAGPLHPRRHDLTKLKKLLLMDLAKLDTRIRRN
ncbi:hypothetical protein Peur_034162 [Populus x canadensis]